MPGMLTCREASRRVAEAEQRAAAAEDGAANVRLELDARPTKRQLASLQRQLSILERRASQVGTTAGDAAEQAQHILDDASQGVLPPSGFQES